jgi:uncharacterized protein (TIGR02001 family)
MKSKLSAAALATSVALGAAVVPSIASAEVSATIGAANMYLWRGLNLTPGGAQVSGSLDYSQASGFYAGAWTSTETDGHETDLYLGFGNEIGGFSYDISYWKYLYPEDRDPTTGFGVDMGDNDLSEYALSVGYGPVTASAYIAAESGADDNNYYTLAATMGDFTLLYGWWDLEFGTVAGIQNEYSHLTLSYAFNDNLSFSISKADSDLPKEDPAYIEEDPLFQVSYSMTFDLK